MKSLRFDLVFHGYIIPYHNTRTYRLKFSFIIGLIENLFILIMMIIKGTYKSTIFVVNILKK
jgi:hypothetical protein